MGLTGRDLLTIEEAKRSAVVSGAGAPSANVGIPGQFYVDNVAKALYGPKNGTDWGTAIPLGGESISVAGGLRGETVPGAFPPVWANSTRLLTATRAWAIRVVPLRAWAQTLVGFEVNIAATTDQPVEVALYDATGARLQTTGPTSGKLNATGFKTLPFAKTWDPASVYYLVLKGATPPSAGTAATLAARTATDQQELYGFTLDPAAPAVPLALGFAFDVAGGLDLPATLPTYASWIAGIATMPKLWMREV